MVARRVDVRLGGLASVLGYLLVLVVLFRHPIRALDAVNADFPGTMYFVGFPVVGTVASAYAARRDPGGAALLTVLGPVLVGFAVLRPVGPVEPAVELPVTVALVVVLVLGTVAILGGVTGAWSTVGAWLSRA